MHEKTLLRTNDHTHGNEGTAASPWPIAWQEFYSFSWVGSQSDGCAHETLSLSFTLGWYNLDVGVDNSSLSTRRTPMPLPA